MYKKADNSLAHTHTHMARRSLGAKKICDRLVLRPRRERLQYHHHVRTHNKRLKRKRDEAGQQTSQTLLWLDLSARASYMLQHQPVGNQYKLLLSFSNGHSLRYRGKLQRVKEMQITPRRLGWPLLWRGQSERLSGLWVAVVISFRSVR